MNTEGIPPEIRSAVSNRIQTCASLNFRTIEGFIKIGVRFRREFCYIEIYQEPGQQQRSCPLKSGKKRENYLDDLRNTPSPLCRLRYLTPDSWTLAIYNFCRDIYEPSLFFHGRSEGTPEEGLITAMQYFYPE